jgi:integrase
MESVGAMKLNKLTVKKIETLEPGTYGDGGNLWLRVLSPTARSWFFRYVRGGKDVWMGLGDANDVTLKMARERAAKWRLVLADHKDPLTEKRREDEEKRSGAEATWFQNVAPLYISANTAGWKNAKHAGQWTATLTQYAYPVIGQKSVRDLGTEDVLKVLSPIWTSKSETASRLRGRIESVLAFAAARGWRAHFNPAAWTNLKAILPAKAKVAKVEHHAALPYIDAARFMEWLDNKAGASALALRFAILTATRSGEVLGARWAEIDLTAKVWAIPAERMKAQREHRVPLSASAIAVLEKAAVHRPKTGDSYIFPGAKDEKPLSNMSMSMLIREDWPNITVHGFRSTFRDWGAEQTAFPRELLEAALAHVVGSKTEAAYARGTMFEKRRILMDAWADHCLGVEGSNVLRLTAGA